MTPFLVCVKNDRTDKMRSFKVWAKNAPKAACRARKRLEPDEFIFGISRAVMA